MMEHRTDVASKEAMQNVANEIQAALHKQTPKRSGKTRNGGTAPPTKFLEAGIEQGTRLSNPL